MGAKSWAHLNQTFFSSKLEPLQLTLFGEKTLTITVVLRGTTQKRLQLLRSRAVRLPNCLQLLWFCVALLQSTYNYCGVARYDSQIAYNYGCFALHEHKTCTIIVYCNDAIHFLVISFILHWFCWSECFFTCFHNVWLKRRERKAGGTLTKPSFLLS